METHRVLRAATILAGVSMVAAKAPPPVQPAALQGIVACRAIIDSAQRLACFDRTSGELTEALAQKDITVLDRQQVRQARRSLFGFALPNLSVFGVSDKDEADKQSGVKELDTTIKAVNSVAYGRWDITVAESDAVWRNIEEVGDKPVVGRPVHITKAALGSYFFKVGSDRAFKAIRVR